MKPLVAVISKRTARTAHSKNAPRSRRAALCAVIMGSKSDWDTMSHASQLLDHFGVAHESKIVSAHRTPKLLAEYASTAEERGIEVIIAGAGGAAHLPWIAAPHTVRPRVGVPVGNHALE